MKRAGALPAKAFHWKEDRLTDLTAWLTASGPELCTGMFSRCPGGLDVGTQWYVAYITHIVPGMTSTDKHDYFSLVIYREAEQHGSTKSGYCRPFCLRSKLLLWCNPGAAEKCKTNWKFRSAKWKSYAIIFSQLLFSSFLLPVVWLHNRIPDYPKSRGIQLLNREGVQGILGEIQQILNQAKV